MNQQGDSNQQQYHLKPLTAENLGCIAEWYENIEDLALIESRLPVPLNVQSLEKVWQNELVQKEPRSSYLFAICDADGNPVGHSGIQDINHVQGNAVVFIYVKKDERRGGVALRTLALMLDLAFLQLRLHRITTYVHSDNLPSIGLLKRLGFVDEGCMRDGCFFNGKYADVNVVGMLCREWQSSRGPLGTGLDVRTVVTFGRDVGSGWSWPPRQP